MSQSAPDAVRYVFIPKGWMTETLVQLKALEAAESRIGVLLERVSELEDDRRREMAYLTRGRNTEGM